MLYILVLYIVLSYLFLGQCVFEMHDKKFLLLGNNNAWIEKQFLDLIKEMYDNSQFNLFTYYS